MKDVSYVYRHKNLSLKWFTKRFILGELIGWMRWYGITFEDCDEYKKMKTSLDKDRICVKILVESQNNFLHPQFFQKTRPSPRSPAD